MVKITHIFEAVGLGYPAGMWFVIVETPDKVSLWECYAWEGQSAPPTKAQQEGYRWRVAGEVHPPVVKP